MNTKEAKAVRIYPPRSLPCKCHGGNHTEHQFSREAFVTIIYVCCKCGQEKAVAK